MAQSAGGGHVGPGAQVDESVAVLVVADRAAVRDLTGQLVIVLSAGYPFDDLELVSVVGEQVLGLPGRRLMTLEGLISSDDLAHPGLDGQQVLVAEGRPAWQFKVVVEAVLDRRADGKGGAGPQVQHGLGQHVGSGVTEGVKAGVAVRGDNCHRRPIHQGTLKVHSNSVKGGYQCCPGQARADVSRQVGRRGPRGESPGRTVGKGDGDLGHAHSEATDGNDGEPDISTVHPGSHRPPALGRRPTGQPAPGGPVGCRGGI